MEASNTAADVDIEPVGTWLVPVLLGQRWAKLAARMGIASAVTALLFYLQFQSDAPAPFMLWGFGIFALGTFLGVRAFGIRERRVFDTTEVRYPHTQRVKRAARWFVPGLVMLALTWWFQVANDQFADYWWYAWPMLFPLLVGVGLYMLRSERVVSAKGQYARGQFAAARAQVAEQRKAWFEAIVESGPVRYIGAAGCLYAAYWLATESTGKNTGWAALAFVVFALFLARELGLWLLGIGIVCGVVWAMFAGIAALPVSVAVIVGALIIASAVRK